MFYFPFFESSFYTVNNDIYIYIYMCVCYAPITGYV